MSEDALTDNQWLVLGLLMKAREKGQPFVTRQELLHSSLPEAAKLQLTFAALTMPHELVEWRGHNVVYITDAGVEAANARFGKKPTQAAAIVDAVIYLPGPSAEQT